MASESTTRLTFSPEQYSDLRGHLFSGKVEQLAFLFCYDRRSDDYIHLECVHIDPICSEDFEYQSEYHIHLRDRVKSNVISKAWQGGYSVIEAHSHRGEHSRARFSGSDMAGFAEFVPHIRWRLQGRTYGALVFTNKEFDALVWANSRTDPSPVEAIVVSNEIFRPTNSTIRRLKAGEGVDEQ